MYITALGKAWFVEAEKIIKKTYKRKKPIEVPCEIYVNVYTSTMRDADASNKPILDAMEHNGVIKNDRLFEACLAFRHKCKRGEDRVEVEVIELE
jgi:Holliday junction resolvase RusA-like endonuclease